MASKNISYKNEIYNISYDLINQKQEKTILILHGWGANKEIMKKAFSRHLPSFCHIYVDLPGFGNSSIYSPLKTVDFKNIMIEFLNSIGKEAEIIMGHSFGGKIATLMSPQRLVLLSSAGIVPPKPLSVRIKIALFKLLKSIGGKNLYKAFATKDVEGMSEVMYETLKNVVDEDMSEEFINFKGECFIFWGDEDKATPLKSGETINRYIKKSEFFPLKGDHFFFLLHSEFITNVIGGERC